MIPLGLYYASSLFGSFLLQIWDRFLDMPGNGDWANVRCIQYGSHNEHIGPSSQHWKHEQLTLSRCGNGLDVSRFWFTYLVLVLVFNSCSHIFISISAETSNPSPPWRVIIACKPDCSGIACTTQQYSVTWWCKDKPINYISPKTEDFLHIFLSPPPQKTQVWPILQRVCRDIHAHCYTSHFSLSWS